MESEIEKAFDEHNSAMGALARSQNIIKTIASATTVCINSLKAGRKILFAGNGGSAADAQHLAGELVSRFQYDRPALSGIALTVDTSVLTAIGNDYGYAKVFIRQLEAIAQPGDVLIALSTSGNSPNVIEAVRWAKEHGVSTIGLTGRIGGKLNGLADICICTPSDNTPRVQEMHILIGHTLCELVERAIFPRESQIREHTKLAAGA